MPLANWVNSAHSSAQLALQHLYIYIYFYTQYPTRSPAIRWWANGTVYKYLNFKFAKSFLHALRWCRRRWSGILGFFFLGGRGGVCGQDSSRAYGSRCLVNPFDPLYKISFVHLKGVPRILHLHSSIACFFFFNLSKIHKSVITLKLAIRLIFVII